MATYPQREESEGQDSTGLGQSAQRSESSRRKTSSTRNGYLQTLRQYVIFQLTFLLVELGSPPRVIVALNTGRNEVSKAMIRLVAPSGVQFQVDETNVEGEGMPFDPDDTTLWLNIRMYAEEVSFEAIDGSIVLFDLKENSTVHLSVPHTDASAYHAMVHPISPSQYRFGG